MNLLQPTYLWWIMALAVPLAIHLLHRGKAKTVKVGSVKFLKRDENNRNRNVRLNELFLLLLRSLMVVLVVLLICGPEFKRITKREALSYFVAPEVLKDKALGVFLDSVASEHPVKLFTHGFPQWDADNLPDSSSDGLDYWQLARALDGYPSDSVVIFTKGYVSRVKGNRPKIAANIRWVVLEEKESNERYVGAVESQVGFNLVKQHMTRERTWFQIRPISRKDAIVQTIKKDSLQLKGHSPIPIINKDTIKVAFTAHSDFETEQDFFSSAIKAISSYTGQPIRFDVVTDANNKMGQMAYDVHIHLGEKMVLGNTVNTITFELDSLQNKLFQQGRTANHWILNKRLTMGNVLKQDLVGHLLEILPLAISSQNLKTDKRQLAEAELQVSRVKDLKPTKTMQRADITPWLWLVLLVVILLERIIAKLRKQ
ncbi:BatA domain-containing protein [Croceitalea dokdonensis]|nr:BatA domain-containing protein [Croceitalea dokdonensis]